MVNFCLVYMSVSWSGFNPNTSLFSTKVKTSELIITTCSLYDVRCFVFEFLSLIYIDVKPLKCEQQKASNFIQQHICLINILHKKADNLSDYKKIQQGLIRKLVYHVRNGPNMQLAKSFEFCSWLRDYGEYL